MNQPSVNQEVCRRCGQYMQCEWPFYPPVEAPLSMNGKTVMFILLHPLFDDQVGTLLSGKTGTSFLRGLELAGLDKRDCHFTCLVKCAPLRESPLTERAFQHCLHFLESEIAELKPALLVGVGRKVGELLGGLLGHQLPDLLVDRPLTKQEEMLQSMVELQEKLEMNEAALKMKKMDEDISVLESPADKNDKNGNGTPVPKRKGKGNMETEELAYLPQVKDFFASAVGKVVAFDTETTSLRAFSADAKLLCLSFSLDGQRGLVLNWTHTGGKQWSGCDKNAVWNILNKFFSNPQQEKVAHNALFDMVQIEACMGIRVHGLVADTMMDAYALNENEPMGLKALAGNVGMAGYEEELVDYILKHPETNPDRGGNYGDIPWHILYPYAAKDVIVTWRLWQKFTQNKLKRTA